MKEKNKILYACKNPKCSIVIGCENIFTKGSIPCYQCQVKNNCTMRAAPLKYANTFTIIQEGYCNSCWEKARKIRHEKDDIRYGVRI